MKLFLALFIFIALTIIHNIFCKPAISDSNNDYKNYLRLKQINEHCNKTLSQTKPQFDKLVLFIIDALRIDFVPTIQNHDAQQRMPYLEEKMKNNGIIYILNLIKLIILLNKN